jgi:hypothetical protein
MKYKTSVAFSSISGSSGDVTASSWKGVGYLRKRVVPKNPKTVAQVAVRAALTACTALYQGLPSLLKTFLNLLGTERMLSGFNVFTKANAAGERTNHYGVIVPSNTHVSNILGLTAAAGAAAGQIAVGWTAAGWTTSCTPVIMVRKTNGSAGFLTPWQVATQSGSPNMTAGTVTITGLTAGASYAVCLMAIDSSSHYSGGVASSATAHA